MNGGSGGKSGDSFLLAPVRKRIKGILTSDKARVSCAVLCAAAAQFGTQPQTLNLLLVVLLEAV